MQALSIAAAALLGYLAGSIPFGYLLVKALRGIDIRDYGSHNIGVSNVARVAGKGTAALCLLLDAGKGLVPVLLAQRMEAGPWGLMLAGTGACVGHAYSLVFLLKEGRFSEGRPSPPPGCGRRFQPPWGDTGGVLGAVLLVWGVPRPVPLHVAGIDGRRGRVRRRCVGHPVDLAYRVFGTVIFLFIVWKHKENLGRLIDGTEVRVGEKVLANIDGDEVACAFVIHPLRWRIALSRADSGCSPDGCRPG